MRIKLTESARDFINTLNESDLEKVTVSDEYIESNDEEISNKVFEYVKARLDTAANRIDSINNQLRIEHPEYFE